MKIFLVLSLSMISLVSCASQSSSTSGAFNVSESKFNFSETVSKFKDLTLKKGWKISVIHDLQETMRKNGVEVLPVSVIESCHPKYAAIVLKSDRLREMSPMMPCRISIYELSDGRTYISRMNMAAMATHIDPDMTEALMPALKESEEIIDSLVE